VSLLLQSATLADNSIADVVISGDTIVWIGDSGSYEEASTETLDLHGYVLTSSFVEPHAHLDKAFLADRIHNPDGDLMGAIRGLHDVRNTITFDDTVERAIRAVHLMSRNGVTAIRTHADTTLDAGLTSILALQEVKRACAHFMDIRIAMLLEWPVSGMEGADHRSLAREAIDIGIDVIGGCPHLDLDPHGAIDYLLGLALETGLPLDLHADENLRPTSNDLEYLAEVMTTDNIEHQIAASHCVSLSSRSENDIRIIADKVASAGISVISLPQTNLFLQGRNTVRNIPRAITPITALRNAGVLVAAGADNLQDPFNLMGRGDPLEIASLLVTASHLNPENAHSMISTNATSVVLNRHAGVAVGMQANLVAVKATTLRESIAMGPPDRHVVYGGVVIDDQFRNRK
jgi:cytosine deaminase